MAEMVRRTKLERFVNGLEKELAMLMDLKNTAKTHEMILHYEISSGVLKQVIGNMRSEFSLKEEQK